MGFGDGGAECELDSTFMKKGIYWRYFTQPNPHLFPTDSAPFNTCTLTLYPEADASGRWSVVASTSKTANSAQTSTGRTQVLQTLTGYVTQWTQVFNRSCNQTDVVTAFKKIISAEFYQPM